jgi:hypothetical protein
VSEAEHQTSSFEGTHRHMPAYGEFHPDLLPEDRLRIVEANIRLLTQQSAEIVVALKSAIEHQPIAIATAFEKVLTDPAILSAIGRVAGDVLQNTAREQTGGWVLKTLKSLVSGWIIRIVFLLVVLKFVGVDAAKMMFDMLKAKAP